MTPLKNRGAYACNVSSKIHNCGMERFPGEAPPFRDEDGPERFEVHSSDPITHESFDELDKTIRSVEEELGIVDGNFCAFSRSFGGIVDSDLRITRYEGPDGLRILDIDSSSGENTSHITIKSEVGMPVMGRMDNEIGSEKSGAQKYRSVITVPNHRLEPNIKRIKELAEQQRFIKIPTSQLSED